MSRSRINLLDLPDEILLMIMKKLNNIDVLYSLLDMNNRRLNILAQEKTFTNALNFASMNDVCFIDRFCKDILPTIHHDVKSFTLNSTLMERILLIKDYPNLNELQIDHFQQEIAIKYFTNESSLQSIFREQITNLILVNDDDEKSIGSRQDYTRNVYAHIFDYFKNLNKLTVIRSPSVRNPPLLLGQMPSTTFSSSILTDLSINVKDFDDCLHLLDGRLTQLRSLSVEVFYMKKSSLVIKKMDDLPNLKYFSLKSFDLFEEYDEIVALLRRMCNLNKLTLYLDGKTRSRVIDGGCLQDCLNYMPKLHSFIFYIGSYVETNNLSPTLSNKDFERIAKNIGVEQVASMVSYVLPDQAACAIFSLPFTFHRLEHLGNMFPNTIYSYVTSLQVEDRIALKHEFFIRISHSFPLLKYLRICNWTSQVSYDMNGLSSKKLEAESYPIVEYPHLISLCVSYGHKDYLEQFLNETKAYVPSLIELRSLGFHLKMITKDFTREETRRNCSKIQRLFTLGSLEHSTKFSLYFPSFSM